MQIKSERSYRYQRQSQNVYQYISVKAENMVVISFAGTPEWQLCPALFMCANSKWSLKLIEKKWIEEFL